jgi:epoxide hydrolase-like predicted phosphatase
VVFKSSIDFKMTKSGKYEAVLFDFGGVLTKSPLTTWHEMEKGMGLKSGSIFNTVFSSEVWPTYQRLEKGEMTLVEFETYFMPIYNKKYNTTITKGLPFSGSSVTTTTTTTTTPPNEMFDMKKMVYMCMIMAVAKLRRRGIKTALVTNNFFFDKERRFPTIPFTDDGSVFDEIIESCRAGCCKPHKEIFAKILKELNVTPDKAIFLDDFEHNLVEAREMGITTILVKDHEDALSTLEKLVDIKLK